MIMLITDIYRQAIESTYTGLCTIIEYHYEKNSVTKISNKTEVTVFDSVPCRLSFESLNTAGKTETAAGITQGVKLFLSPDITVNSGSKIIVKQNGVTTVYCASGVPAVYPTHCEVPLELFRGWA